MPIPPILYLSQDRTFAEALLLYWSSTNVEERTKLKLLIPFALTACTPRSRTLVTPVYGHRIDADGKAGFVGSYFFRRDRTAQSDVLFPLFARVVDERRHTVIALNTYFHKTPAGSHGGVVPFAFWGSGRDGSSYAYVPPLVWHAADRASTTTLALNSYLRVHRNGGGHDVGLWPLYFGGRHREHTYDVVPPLLFARWGERERQRVWWLTGYYEGDPDGWSLSFVPLYFGGRRGEDHHQAVLPPLFAHWGGRRSETTLVLNTFFTRERRSRDWAFGFVPLLFASGSGRGDRLTIAAAIGVHLQSPHRSTTALGPLYLHRDSESYDLGVFPLLLHGGRRAGGHYTVLPPLLSWHVRDQRGDFTTFSLPLLFAHSRTGPTRSLWWGPLYSYRDPGGWTFNVAPLVFAARRGARHHTAILPPLLVHVGDERREITLVGNTYLRRERTGDFAFSFFPLVFAGRGAGTAWFVAPPVIHVRDPLGATTIVGPAFHHRDPSGWDAGLLPIYFQGRSGTRRYLYLAPLVWDWGDDGAGTRRTLAGPFYRWRSPDAHHVGLVPLFFHGRTGTWRYTVTPLLPFWYAREPGRSFLVVGPFYRNRTPAEWHAGVLPLWVGGRAGSRHYSLVPLAFVYDWGDRAIPERTTIVPLGYRYRGPDRLELGLIPLVFAHREGREHLVVSPPLLTARWGDGEREGLLALGLIYRFRDPDAYRRGLFPLVMAGDTDLRAPQGPSRYRVVLPPLFIHRRSPVSATTVLLPGYVHTRVAGGWDAGLAPLWFSGRDPGAGSYYDHVLPPVFMRWGDRRSGTLVAGPVYYDREPDGRHFGVVPLYFGGRDARGGRYDVALPFFVRAGDRERETTWSLLYYSSREGRRRQFGLFPFYLGGRDLDERGRAFDAVLPPLFIHWRDRFERRIWAAPVFHYRGAFERQTVVFPIYWGGRDLQRDSAYDVVLPLFARWRDRDGATTVLLPGFHHRDRDGYDLGVLPLVYHGAARDGRHYTHVLPLYFHTGDRERETTLLVPLAWHHRAPGRVAAGLLPLVLYGRDDRARSSYLAVLPPLFVHWRERDSCGTVVLAYFDARRPRGRTRGLLPLWLEHWEEERFTRAVTPLLWQWGDARGRATLLLPLAYHERRGASSLFLSPLVVSHVDAERQLRRLVVFPLWWRFRGPDADVNVGFPLYWDFHAPLAGRRLSILFPLGFHRATRTEATTMVLNVLYSRGRGDHAGAWSVHFFPLLEIGSYNPEHLKWQLLLGLLGHERQRGQQRWRLFYVWTDVTGGGGSPPASRSGARSW